MKRIFYLLLLCTLLSCEKKIQIISCEEFKTDVHRFPFSTYDMLCVELHGDNLYHTSRYDKRFLLSYDFNSDEIDTIIKDDRIIDIEVVDDSCVFYANYLYKSRGYQIKNVRNKSYDYFGNVHETVSHPFWKDDYECVPVFPDLSLKMIDDKSGIVSCREAYVFAKDYSVVLENDVPVYLRFEIAADSSIMPISFFGEYPKDHPKDNYHDTGELYQCYNHISKEIVTYTEVDDYVVLCDSMGNKIRDVYFGSQLYEYSPYPKEKKNIMAESINHYYNNTLYSNIVFDEYRNLYYRAMSVPRAKDEESMIREDVVDVILVVADENLDIKYEVFFDGYEYHPILEDGLINEKGFLVYEKENKEWKACKTAAWFVFE